MEEEVLVQGVGIKEMVFSWKKAKKDTIKHMKERLVHQQRAGETGTAMKTKRKIEQMEKKDAKT